MRVGSCVGVEEGRGASGVGGGDGVAVGDGRLVEGGRGRGKNEVMQAQYGRREEGVQGGVNGRPMRGSMMRRRLILKRVEIDMMESEVMLGRRL